MKCHLPHVDILNYFKRIWYYLLGAILYCSSRSIFREILYTLTVGPNIILKIDIIIINIHLGWIYNYSISTLFFLSFPIPSLYRSVVISSSFPSFLFPLSPSFPPSLSLLSFHSFHIPSICNHAICTVLKRLAT